MKLTEQEATELADKIRTDRHKLRKHYNIQFLEDLLERVKEDEIYLEDAHEVQSTDQDKSGIFFKLKSIKMFEDRWEWIEKRPWWKFWER